MTAVIVDHETGTRDARRLGGLAALMPITATIATVAGLSMAGIAPLNGFLSKEMMLEESAHTVWADNPWILPTLATLGPIFSAAYSFSSVFHRSEERRVGHGCVCTCRSRLLQYN